MIGVFQGCANVLLASMTGFLALSQINLRSDPTWRTQLYAPPWRGHSTLSHNPKMPTSYSVCIRVLKPDAHVAQPTAAIPVRRSNLMLIK